MVSLKKEAKVKEENKGSAEKESLLSEIVIEKAEGASVRVRLQHPEKLSLAYFDRMERDEWILSCMLADESKGLLLYGIDGLVSLRNFLERYTFKRAEGYRFLEGLMERAMHVSRSKPVVLSLDTVYLSPYGEEARFMALPIQTDEWMFRQEETDRFLQEVAGQFLTEDAFELIGFLMMQSRNTHLPFSGVIGGLCDLEEVYSPRRFWQKRKTEPFRSRFPVSAEEIPVQPSEPAGFLEAEPDDSAWPVLQEERGERKTYSRTHDSFFEDQTQALFSLPETGPCLELAGKKYSLLDEETEIGRDPACRICLPFPDMAGIHCRIFWDKEQGRFYLQALPNTAGTFLNDKKVVRRMRLKDGMTLRIGVHSGVFHEG